MEVGDGTVDWMADALSHVHRREKPSEIPEKRPLRQLASLFSVDSQTGQIQILKRLKLI